MYIRRLAWILGIGIFCAAALLVMPAGIDAGGDSAQYIVLAESISRGQGLHAVNFPDQPFFFYYPPLFPLLLVPAVFFGTRLLWLMHGIGIVSAVGVLLFGYRLIKKYTNAAIALMSIVLLASNPFFILYSGAFILSDMPFVCVMLAAFVYIEKYMRQTSLRHYSGAYAAVFLVCAYFTRYAGITMCAALAACFFNARQYQAKKKTVLLAGVFMGCVIAWQAIVVVYGGRGTTQYAAIFSEGISGIAARIAGQSGYYFRVVAETLFPWIRIHRPAALGMECFAAAGMCAGIWTVRRQVLQWPFFWFSICYGLLLLLWPFQEGMRFLLPIMLLGYVFLVSALRAVVAKISPIFVRICVIVCIVCAVCVSGWYGISATMRSFIQPQVVSDFFILHRWMKHHIPASQVVISRKPSLTYYLSGHQAEAFAYSNDDAIMWQVFKNTRARFVVIDGFTRSTAQFLVPFLKRNQRQFRFVYQQGSAVLLAYVPTP